MHENDIHTVREKKVIFKSYQIVWYFLGVFETLLFFRFIFRLLGANTTSAFTQLVYALSYPLVYPFQGIFPQRSAGTGSTLEWSSLVAMFVYLVGAWGLAHLLQIIKPTNIREVERKLDAS